MILKISKLFVFVLLIFSSAQTIMAQGEERPMTTTANATNLYIEFAGPSIVYSFNLDARFGKYENGLGFRVGIGGAYVDGEGFMSVPIQLNYLIGTKGKYLEVGGGYTYAPNLYLFNNENPNYGTITIGYRKQPLGKKGFLFRAGFTPLISFGEGGGFIPYAGVSCGLRF